MKVFLPSFNAALALGGSALCNFMLFGVAARHGPSSLAAFVVLYGSTVMATSVCGGGYHLLALRELPALMVRDRDSTVGGAEEFVRFALRRVLRSGTVVAGGALLVFAILRIFGFAALSLWPAAFVLGPVWAGLGLSTSILRSNTDPAIALMCEGMGRPVLLTIGLLGIGGRIGTSLPDIAITMLVFGFVGASLLSVNLWLVWRLTGVSLRFLAQDGPLDSKPSFIANSQAQHHWSIAAHSFLGVALVTSILPNVELAIFSIWQRDELAGVTATFLRFGSIVFLWPSAVHVIAMRRFASTYIDVSDRQRAFRQLLQLMGLSSIGALLVVGAIALGGPLIGMVFPYIWKQYWPEFLQFLLWYGLVIGAGQVAWGAASVLGRERLQLALSLGSIVVLGLGAIISVRFPQIGADGVVWGRCLANALIYAPQIAIVAMEAYRLEKRSDP